MNDSLDDLFNGDTGSVRVEPVRANAVEYKPAETRFIEGCPKCRGTGRYGSFGICFTCNGKGKKVFKTAPATREQNRFKAMERKERIAQDSVDAFNAAHPAEYAWLVDTAARWDVAASLLAGLQRYGTLTEKQLALVQNGIARDASRALQRAERAAGAPVASSEGVDRLKAAFDTAIAYSAAKGLKMSPRITVDGLTISPAKAASANPGALYVKAGQTYLGKVTGGRFFASRECNPADQSKVLAFIDNPAEAAKVYGQTTGTCCVCNATLRSDWKLRGIGPICAEKFGW